MASTTDTSTTFNFDLAGALGATEVRTIGTSTVTVPAAVAAAMLSELAWFRTQTNVTKRSLILPSEEAANTLRAQIIQWGKNTGHSCATPETDRDGVPLNVGTMVTYRLTTPKARKASKSGPVTVSQVATDAPKADAPKADAKAAA